MNVAFFDPKYQHGGCYRLATGKKEAVHPHPSSVMFSVKKKPPLCIFNVVVETSRKFMRDMLAIREEWLLEEAPMVFARPTSSSVLS